MHPVHIFFNQDVKVEVWYSFSGPSPVPLLPSLIWSARRPPESEHVLLRGGRAAVAHPHGAGEPQEVVLAAPLVEPEHVVGRRSGEWQR